MIFSIHQAHLRHPECATARANKENTFAVMRRSLDTIHHVVLDGIPPTDGESPTPAANGDSGISLAQHQPTAGKACKEFDVGIA